MAWENGKENALERDDVPAVVLVQDPDSEPVEEHDIPPLRVVRVKRRLATMACPSCSRSRKD